jgi:DNA-binding CsgD family transcriptional regulator
MGNRASPPTGVRVAALFPALSGSVPLTARQLAVLELAARGLSDKEIGVKLGISRRTVQDRFDYLRQRTGARSRTELVARAAEAGLIRSGSDIFSAERAGRQERIPGDQLPVGARSGTLAGYACGIACSPDLGEQVSALRRAGCAQVFTERLNGRTAARPHLNACLDRLRPGDTLVVASLERLAAGLPDLITVLAALDRFGLGLWSLDEELDTTIPGGHLVRHVFAVLGAFAHATSAESAESAG